MKELIKRFEQEKDGRWVGYCEPIGVSGYGNTKKEAEKNLDELVDLYFKTLKELSNECWSKTKEIKNLL